MPASKTSIRSRLAISSMKELLHASSLTLSRCARAALDGAGATLNGCSAPKTDRTFEVAYARVSSSTGMVRMRAVCRS
jgi:hypothetical protein